jgi:hypothetical protein
MACGQNNTAFIDNESGRPTSSFTWDRREFTRFLSAVLLFSQ